MYHPSPMVELTPSRHAHKEIQPYPFPTKFKEMLRISSPAVPPGLLKMNTKRTDGKVRVMCTYQRVIKTLRACTNACLHKANAGGGAGVSDKAKNIA